MKSTFYIILAILVFSIGFGGGYYFSSKKYTAFIQALHLVRSSDKNTPFVHPLVGLDVPNALSISQFIPLSQKINSVFQQNSGLVSRYSVYFRDLNKGLWVGINENDSYDPASMLKVALAMAAYKQNESDPDFIQSAHEYTPELAAINTSNPYNDPSELKVGQSYTIEYLVSKMLINSDNGAKDILGNIVDSKIINDVYSALGISIPTDSGGYKISAKKYSSFFRILYSGSYLSNSDSNTLLSLLSAATFKNGIVVGVSASTTVSHKFGEHINTADNTINSTELHDCGIVYHPTSPYVLCVMTEGKNESDLSDFIQQVSSVVYQEVNNGYK
ncbi:MAG: serine hydrolase [bacterium]